MSDLIVTPGELTKTIKELDITFTNGIVLPLSIDESAGDSIEDTGDKYIVRLTAKASPIQPNETIPAEIFYVFKQNVIVLQERMVTRRLASPDEQFELRQFINKVADKKVH